MRAIHYRFTPRLVNKGSLSQLPPLHTWKFVERLESGFQQQLLWAAKITFSPFWSEMFMRNQQNAFAALTT